MDIALPLATYASTDAMTNLWIALGIGVIFGVFLEQGGMGSATRIMGQFTLRNFAVLKIMFSAIVTCAIGLYWFAQVGLLNYDQLVIEPTYLWAQASGAILFGFGFIVGGLCPGTACVAVASGRGDGVALLIGIFAGIVLFNETFTLLEPLYYSAPVEARSLPQLLEWGEHQMLALLTTVALSAFLVAHRIEKSHAANDRKQTS